MDIFKGHLGIGIAVDHIGDLQVAVLIHVGDGDHHGADRCVIGDGAQGPGAVAVLGSIGRDLLPDQQGVLAHIVCAEDNVFKDEAAVSLDSGLCDHRIVADQFEGKITLSDGLFVGDGLGAGQVNGAGLGTVEIIKGQGVVVGICHARVDHSLSVGHLSVALIGNDDSDVVLSTGVVDTCRLAGGDMFLNHEVIGAHAQGAQTHGKVTVCVMGGGVADQNLIFKVHVCLVQLEAELAVGQAAAGHELLAGQGHGDGVRGIGVDELQAVRAVAFDSCGQSTVAVVSHSDLHGADRVIIGHAGSRAGDLADGVGEGLTGVCQGILDGGELEVAGRVVGDGLQQIAIAVVQAEGVVACVERLHTAEDLQGLIACDGHLGRLCVVGVQEINGLLGGVLEVVGSAQLAVAAFDHFHHQVVDGLIIGHARSRALDLHHVVVISADFGECHACAEDYVAIFIVGADGHSALGGGVACLAVGEDGKGKLAGLNIAAFQMLGDGGHDVQIHRGIRGIVGIGKLQLCGVAADIHGCLGAVGCHPVSAELGGDHRGDGVFGQDHSQLILGSIIAPAGLALVLFLDNKMIGDHIVAIGVIIIEVPVVVVANQAGLTLGIGLGASDEITDDPVSIGIHGGLVGLDHEACRGLMGTCIVCDGLDDVHRGGGGVVLVGEHGVDGVAACCITGNRKVFTLVVAHQFGLQIAICIHDHIDGECVDGTVVGDV